MRQHKESTWNNQPMTKPRKAQDKRKGKNHLKERRHYDNLGNGEDDAPFQETRGKSYFAGRRVASKY